MIDVPRENSRFAEALVLMAYFMTFYGCVPDSDWSRLISFEDGAECGVNPNDLLCAELAVRISEVQESYGRSDVDLSSIDIYSDAPFDSDEIEGDLPGYLGHIYEMMLRWLDGDDVMVSLHGDGNWYLYASGGYFCDDGTFVYDFREEPVAQLLAIGDMDLTLDDGDIRYMANPTVVSVYNNCPYDPEIPIDGYAEECDVVAEGIEGETFWAL